MNIAAHFPSARHSDELEQTQEERLDMNVFVYLLIWSISLTCFCPAKRQLYMEVFQST